MDAVEFLGGYMPAAYALFGAAIAALFFYAGWKFRDSVGVTRGEAPVIVAQSTKSTVLEDWDVTEEV